MSVTLNLHSSFGSGFAAQWRTRECRKGPMKKAAPKHWGQWVASRSEFLGFKRQADLARAVGTTRERIARWCAMEQPPRQMRKGFDEKLAAALRVDRGVLYTGWQHVKPDNGRTISTVPADATPRDLLAAERKIRTIKVTVNLLRGADLDAVLDLVLKLLRRSEGDSTGRKT
jgi:hypothetical protein